MPELAGRPTLIKGNRSCCSAAWAGCRRTRVVNIKNKSHSVTAEIVVPDGGAEGVIVAQGGSIGGWSLYAKDGRPKYCYNLLGIRRFYVDGDDARSRRARTRCAMEFAYDGGGLGKGGTVTLSSTARRSARAASTRPRR